MGATKKNVVLAFGLVHYGSDPFNSTASCAPNLQLLNLMYKNIV